MIYVWGVSKTYDTRDSFSFQHTTDKHVDLVQDLP